MLTDRRYFPVDPPPHSISISAYFLYVSLEAGAYFLILNWRLFCRSRFFLLNWCLFGGQKIGAYSMGGRSTVDGEILCT